MDYRKGTTGDKVVQSHGYIHQRFLSSWRRTLFSLLFSIVVNTSINHSKVHGWKLSNLFRRNGFDHNENGRNADDSSMNNADNIFERSSDEKNNRGSAREIHVDTATAESADVGTMKNDEGWFAWNSIIEDSPLHLLVDDFSSHSKDSNGIVSDECEVASELDSGLPALFRRFSRILPTLLEKTQQLFKVSKEHISRIILYQPPVGVVTVIVVLRLVLSGRLFRWCTYYYNHDVNIEDRLFLQKIQQKDRSSQYRKRRSFVVNSDDASYNSFGGVERVRTRLCLAALQNVLISLESSMSSSDESKSSMKRQQYADLVRLAIVSLTMSSSPIGSWLQLVYETIVPLSQIEELESQLQIQKMGFRQPVDDVMFYLSEDHLNSSSNVPSNGVMNLLSISITTGQLRLYDALLRLCRDRVLQTTYRLARTVEHWERRLKFNAVSNSMRLYRLLRRILRIHTVEDDRLGLSLAKAAYNMEVKRLGEITALLMDRPLEMDESNVIYALKAAERRRLLQSDHEMPSSTQAPPVGSSSDNPTRTLSGVNVFASGLLSAVRTLPSSFRNLSKYSFRWKADGKGFLSIRKFDNSDGYIDGRSAFEVLSPNEKTNSLSNDVGDRYGGWTKQAQEWINHVQRLIFLVIGESLQSSRSTSLSSDCSEGDFKRLQEQWYLFANGNESPDQQQQSHNQPPDAVTSLGILNREQQWRSIVNYIDSSTSWQRIGEGEKIRLRDVFGIKDWITRLDILGIPSSILFIYIAHQLHKRFVIPHWSTVQQHIVDVSQKVFEILQQRVWVPMKGIYDDIMNRSPSMMSALGLEVEETSLDHMLRDLNFGDGTPATRQEAIRKATEQYEHDLSHGLFANFARGRLIRLLLIQVQQLKVGMLSALDTIDVLIEGNRIHFKVLAAIPAFAIVTFGTRYFFRALYNIRAKDLRPLSAVHSEMTQYLNRIEKILLLSSEGDASDSHDRFERKSTLRAQNSTLSSRKGQRKILKPIELGEMVLNTHRYLILLDFSSPQPFPASLCDEIHSSLQQFFNSAQEGRSDRSSIIHRLDSSRQIQWLSTIQQKHQDLAKFL